MHKSPDTVLKTYFRFKFKFCLS